MANWQRPSIRFTAYVQKHPQQQKLNNATVELTSTHKSASQQHGTTDNYQSYSVFKVHFCPQISASCYQNSRSLDANYTNASIATKIF